MAAVAICMQVFMLGADMVLDEAMLNSILESGHSRIPIYRSNRCCPPLPRWAEVDCLLNSMAGRISLTCLACCDLSSSLGYELGGVRTCGGSVKVAHTVYVSYVISIATACGGTCFFICP